MIHFDGCKQLESCTDIIEIESNGDVWDLHNSCEFVEFTNKIPDKRLILTWNYYDYNSGLVSKNIFIILSCVTMLKITPRDSDMPSDEDTCLERLIYYADNNKLIFEFRGGVFIEVICTELSFKTIVVSH